MPTSAGRLVSGRADARATCSAHTPAQAHSAAALDPSPSFVIAVEKGGRIEQVPSHGCAARRGGGHGIDELDAARGAEWANDRSICSAIRF